MWLLHFKTACVTDGESYRKYSCNTIYTVVLAVIDYKDVFGILWNESSNQWIPHKECQ